MSTRSPKLRLALASAIVLVATTAACVLGGVVLDRLSVRIDVTALGEHRLSPRTAKLIESLDARHEIVLAGPWRELARLGRSGDLSADPRAVQATLDVLREFDRASGSIDATIIDTSTSDGQTQYEALLDRLGTRDGEAVAQQRQAVLSALDSLDTAIAEVGRTAQAIDGLAGLADATDAFEAQLRTELQRRAAQARAVETDQRRQAEAARELLVPQVGGSELVAVDDALGAAQGIAERFDTQLTELGEILTLLASSDRIPPTIQANARPIGERIKATRDTLALEADALATLPRLDSVRVARLLAVGPAALVIGPAERAGSITGISFDALFPLLDAQRAATGIGADARQHAEEVLLAALTAVQGDTAPILIFVHGEARRGLLEGQAMAGLQRRLGLRRIDLLEWAAAIEPDPPSTLPIDPSQTRPVVYVTLGTDARVVRGLADQSLNGPARAAALGRALERLAEQGEAMLISLALSPAPARGATDDAVDFLGLFGLEADTGRPLMSSITTGDGSAIDIETRPIVPDAADHALAEPIRGIVTTLRWAVPLAPIPATGGEPVDRSTLLVAQAQDRWAEADWGQVYTEATRLGAAVLRGRGVPTPMPGLDDTAGPWPVAVAVERSLAGLDRPQRAVVVGGNGWFFDAQTQASEIVSGRQMLTSPGNLELFENSVAWLSFRDDEIAQAAATGSVPRIETLSADARGMLGWMLIAGLPMAILLVGVGLRLIRR